MRVTMRMPIKKQYNLVTNDELDTRVPLHPEEAFTHGIKFLAKYIGTLDVPRPTSRVEIVAAMRRIRYEFKAKGIKKKKVSLEISVDGVKISKRKKKKHRTTSPDSLLLMTHPIYRIFYVSHDSQDLKIFSYIARDASSNVFRCHVFKANKKNQAMRVVRTVGQAFEVVHKMSIKEKSPSPERLNDDHSSIEGSQDSSEKINRDGLDSESGPDDLMTLTSDAYNEEPPQSIAPSRPTHLDPLAPPIGSENIKRAIGETFTSPLSEPLDTGDFLPQAGTPLSVHHELQLLREQLGQQQQQTQAAVAQVHLLRDQLAAETAARLEAQARTHQLLVHNKELLEHIQQLVLQVRDLELKFQGSGTAEGSVASAIQLLPNAPDLKQELRASQQQLRQRELALKLHQLQHQTMPGEEKIDASIDVDAFHDSSGNSSKESVSSAIAQLFASEAAPMWLPRVPEDSVTSGPLWNTVNLGSQRCPPQPRGLQPSGPITRAASERYSRQETLAQLQRMAWARHTTK